MADPSRVIEAWLHTVPAAAPALPFVERAFEVCHDPGSVAFRAAYASVARRLGAIGSAPPLTSESLPAGGRGHWSLVDWVRAALVCRALEYQPEGERRALVQALFEGGELGEQESLLRTLTILPGAEDYVETALLGCRTNARRVFEAVACDNEYPELRFDELGYNQMVLKAIFLEVPVARIDGLAKRRTSELVRMVRSYESERRAAGRSVPEDVAFILQGTSS